jgi:hypothetical protein
MDAARFYQLIRPRPCALCWRVIWEQPMSDIIITGGGGGGGGAVKGLR